MENDFKNCLECSDTQQENEQGYWKLTWEEIFDGVPTAPGTEAAQERHKQLREQDTMTEQEEMEFDALFYEIYPEFIPDPRKKGQIGEDALKRTSLGGKETVDHQCEITLAMLLLEVCWCWITALHCGMTFHGLIGCFIVVWCCLIVNHLMNRKEPEMHL